MSEGCLKKLNRCFNAAIRYVFRLRKYDHLSAFRNRLIGCSLSAFFDFRVCWFIKQLMTSCTPLYLYNKLNFSFNYKQNLRLTIRSNSLRCNNAAIFVKGVMLWNRLPLSLKKISSRSVFFEKFLSIRDSSDYI